MERATRWTVGDALRERYRHITGSPVEHDVRRYLDAVAGIDDRHRATHLDALSDAELRAHARALAAARTHAEPDDMRLHEIFAVAREGAARFLGLRPFDVQLAAGLALHQGCLAQMATGEGKTLTAVPAAIAHAAGGGRVHVFTANDYLASRDAAWMAPVYDLFGLRVAAIVASLPQAARKDAYRADVVYVTAKEAGFDFLRDHTASDAGALVHDGHDFAIVDEADCILIDEARIPLVIAGPTPALPIDHRRLAALARELRRGIEYDADEYGRTVVLTERGFAAAGDALGVRLHEQSAHLLLSALHVALHAEALLRRDRDYVVRDGIVALVDDWTGRVAENRRWPHGIQPAVEAKEGLPVRAEGRILGSVPMQHFVRQYAKLAGMTATAESSADEFHSFFGLRTVVFPPHRICARIDHDDVVFTHREAKAAALLDEIAAAHASGRPVLVGTASVSESEALSRALSSRGVPHDVLNARQDSHEAEVIARAGALGAVTISTNMAGRGTDIRLGGPDERDRDAVAALGGLYVIGTNRHESRRIDQQLRGRAGRQGDPGSSRFFIALDDDLITRYGVLSLIPKAHLPERRAGAIDDVVVSREIARAQRIIEGQNFEIRRTLWKYSAMVEEQREVVYTWRRELLDGTGDADDCQRRLPEKYQALVSGTSLEAVRAAERRVTIAALDALWSDHLARIEDIREGIHLQRYGGLEPISEFHRQIVAAFDEMMNRLGDESGRLFARLDVKDGAIDFTAAGLGRSSATWTYLVNDNPFSTLGQSLMSTRNIGAAATLGFMAVIYMPVTMIVTATIFLRRWLARRAGRR
jgi:preprotein translocase subunit SecA